MPLQAVAVDLDGTLLNSKRTVSKPDIETLENLESRNVTRIVATGRSFFSCMQVLAHDFPIDYLIFSAGAGIMNFPTKEIFYKKFLIRSELMLIVEKLTELQLDFQVRLKVPNGHKYYYRRFFKENSDFDFLNRAYRDHIQLLRNTSVLREATRVIAILPDETFVQTLYDEFQEFGIVRATSPVNNKYIWIEIFPKYVNKGTALDYLSAKINIPTANMLGLGNDYNDIDFLNITGKSFMVNNAAENLKQMYEVTVSNDENPLTVLAHKFEL